jgi:uncharacterized protein
MHDQLDMILAWCSPGGLGLSAGLFLAGLAGGPMHCGPMCGPFVLGQAAERLAALPAARLCEFARLRAGVLAPYHLGRLIVYGGLGAAAGALGAAPGLGRLSAALLLAAALLFALHALGRLVPALKAAIPAVDHAPAGWVSAIARVTRQLDRRHWLGGLGLGLALGFLPCGFLYAAIAAAGAAGGAWSGAFAMLAFGAGTVPTLVAVGLAGQAAGQVWHRKLLRVAPAVMLFNAALLALMAARALLA